MSDLQEEIDRQTRGRKPKDVTELILDKCKATKLTGLDEFSNLQSISLNGVGLTTLEGFPTLPKLTKVRPHARSAAHRSRSCCGGRLLAICRVLCGAGGSSAGRQPTPAQQRPRRFPCGVRARR